MIFPWLAKLLPESFLGKAVVITLLLLLLFIILFIAVYPNLDALLVDPPTVE